MNHKSISALLIAACGMAVPMASATVAVGPLFSDHSVLQRGGPCPVWGTAAAGKTITVTYNGQTKTTTSDAQGNWRLALDSMAAKTTGASMTVNEAGGNTLNIADVVVGDVWIGSGQSNMAFGLNGCNRQTDIDSANYQGIRHIWVPLVTADNPLTTFSGTWSVCSPATAGGFSAVAFYFGRKIYTDQGATIPIGLIASTVGGTCIDPWLVQEGCTDQAVLSPLFSQNVLPWGPFSLANGMIHPLATFACKGAIWYQGENRETTSQSTDSYFFKEKALQQGWKRRFGLNDFALYVVQLANYLDPATTTTPDGLGSWAETRQMQEMVVNLAHGGAASALDVGDALDIHPKDKLDVGERLALWALKNDYGRSTIVPSGPILRDTVVVGSTTTYPARKSIICGFDYVGAGLMVGSKTPYLPTSEVSGGTLQKFVIAGATGSWYAADAVINGNTVEVSSAAVANPTKVAYAYWTNPAGANLYNKDGLPASPFYVDDVTAKFTVTASAGANGSITPPGPATYLKRRTALYTITANPGYFIQDVLVDGVSVGAVRNYTFDPLYANHAISASFAATNPNYNITTSANTGGSFSPAGPLAIAAGGATTLNIVPNTGYRLISMTLDGASIGRRNYLTFADVRASHAATAFFAPIPTPGTGTGLRGEYFVGQNFEIFRSTRTDTTVNFDWATNAPIGTLPADGFSIRWQGQIEPQFTETYRFYLTHDDGAKLWVNNQLVINNWGGTATDDSGTIALTAGVKVPIKIEYFDYLSNATCKLDWSSPSIIRENVPQTQLSPATDPVHTITTSAGTGGSLTPSGTVLAYAGTNRSFNVLPDTGYGVANVLVDGVSQGTLTAYTFTNLAANHTISATFNTLSTYAVSGKVIAQNGGTAISGATVGLYPSATSTGSPSYTATTDASGSYTKSVPMGTWYAYASATNCFVSSAQTVTVGAGPVTGINFALAPGTRNVPRSADLLFSAVTDALPASGTIGSWSTYQPSGTTLSAINHPTVEAIHSVKWEQNLYADGDGFTVGSAYSSPITVNGASMVVAIKPLRSSDSGNWRSIVDIFYDRLVLGIANNNGQVMVRRNGGLDWASTATAIPDGQMTILSLVMQPDGTYRVWANGTQIMNITTTNAMTSLVNGVAGTYANYINVGRNWPDGWSVYNGNIGDVFVYKIALTDTERLQLETDVKNKFGMGAGYNITATSGTGGAVSPAGTMAITQGGSLTYAISPIAGYSIASVQVDGVNQGAIGSYTFTNVNANHTIAASFSGSGATTYTVTASAGAGGSISPAGAVTVNAGANQTFTIAPNSGYAISDVTVDGTGVGAVTSYTFTSVAANHTIAATFSNSPVTYTITASAGTGGSISPPGAVTVNSGANQTFAIAPNSGYAISGVTVDGVGVGAVATYTFANVAANHTIAATFSSSPVTYTITASAGTGGSISPSGVVTASAGANQTFTIAPNSGYAISGVTVDGAGVGAVASHTFTSMAANHTIAANFAPVANTPPSISTVANQNIATNTATATLAFTVGDAETPAADLTITAVSSNTTLVPSANVTLGGSGANRTVRVTPATNQSGTSTITLTVSDGASTASSSFMVTVTAPGTPKAISINVGFNGTLAAGDTAGVVPVTHWNELSGTTNNPSSSSLVDESGGAVAGMTVSFQGNGNTFNNTGGAAENDRRMLSGFLTGDPMSCHFTNIPYATYDVYVYYSGFNNNNCYSLTWVATDTQTSSVLGIQYSVRGTLTGPQMFPTPGMVQSNFTTLAAADAQAALGNGGNWLKFTGLTAANLKIAETSNSYFNENGFSGIQIVNTAVPNTLATWIAGFPAVGSATGFDDDPDSDGLHNGLENYLGSNPSQFNTGLTRTSATGRVLRFRHTRSNDIAADVTAIYQWSSDMAHWFSSGQTNGQGVGATIATAVVTDANAPDNDVIEVTVTANGGTPARIFARIQANQAP